KQYCNGSRIPPEFGGSGYDVPPGTNEGNVPTPIFNLTAGATVDEGNNWINISWGPLAMTNPATGIVLGNYALSSGSPAIDYVTPGGLFAVAYNNAPIADFFGNARKTTSNPNVDVGAVEGAGSAGSGTASIAPSSVAFGNVAVNSNSLAQTLTLTNNTGGNLTGIGVTLATTSTPTTPNVFTRPAGPAGGTCGATLANGSSCTILVVFRPVAVTPPYTGTATILASAGVIGSPVALSGTGFTKPTLNVLDNFNRANANTLGSNWQQLVLAGAAGIRVNTNQAFCGACAGAANAYWGPATFGAKQAAAFTIANATLNTDSVILSATGALTLGAYPNHLRVLYNGGNVTVATTITGGIAYTTAGSVAGAFLSGDIITAVLDGSNTVNGSPAPAVSIWRTRAGIDTFIGTVPVASNALWQSGGRIGMQLQSGARVDDFAGGTLP
ncbi:MAG TPA: hypothetical protein VHS31_08820, partial [Tepidisphaeraceae bacterium]|nr:hypothetical protein [Tepidisphaeraceae bacterium]